MYLQERFGFVNQADVERGGSYESIGEGGSKWRLHLDPVVAAASESFPCPTTKSRHRFFRWGLMPADDDISLGLLACWPLHHGFLLIAAAIVSCCDWFKNSQVHLFLTPTIRRGHSRYRLQNRPRTRGQQSPIYYSVASFVLMRAKLCPFFAHFVFGSNSAGRVPASLAATGVPYARAV